MSRPPADAPAHSLVIPVYGNAEGIDALLAAVRSLADALHGDLEVVFVVDGSPDDSLARLRAGLPGSGVEAQLAVLARNFGAFAAIRAGLGLARGRAIAVMAADLQEPPELVLTFFSALRADRCDVAFGQRTARADPGASKLASRLFWGLYRRLVMPDVPSGGVDIFGLSARFRDELLRLGESNSSLLAQLFWLGGRRLFVPYARRARGHGVSAWTLRKKLRYLADSVFAFTDLPVRLLTVIGALGLVVAAVAIVVVLLARLSGAIDVPGYAATMLAVMFFGALNTLGIGLVGTYAWRAYENSKQRPLAVVQSVEAYGGSDGAGRSP